MIPVVLAIGGSDSSGGAGIQVDSRTIDAWGAWPATVVTAITAQNTTGVQAANALDARWVAKQLDAVLDDMNVVAVKTGMLASGAVIRVVAEALRARHPAHVVSDPVLASGGGAPLLEENALDALRQEMIPQMTLITPNVGEAERLTGRAIRSVDDAARAGQALRELGATAALVTGGHLPDAPGTDVLVTADGVTAFPPDWIDVGRVHGTGCVLASSIAAALALGRTLPDAVAQARTFVRDALRHSVAVGAGDRCLVPGGRRSVPEAP